MARPRKRRRVCALPEINQFGPLDLPSNQDIIYMTVDEYESIRLIDLEGFNQTEAADQMKIARSTVQATYVDARQKLADALVNGKVLKIQGGDYRLCDGSRSGCGRGCRRRRHENGGCYENRFSSE